MIRPTDVERAPERSSRAIVLRRNPSWAAAAWTFAAVASATYCSPFITREAVFRLTPDSAATWRSVGRLGTARSLASDIVILVVGRAAASRRGSAFRKHRLRTSDAREARPNQAGSGPDNVVLPAAERGVKKRSPRWPVPGAARFHPRGATLFAYP